MPEVELLDHMVIIFNTFWVTTTLFSTAELRFWRTHCGVGRGFREIQKGNFHALKLDDQNSAPPGNSNSSRTATRNTQERWAGVVRMRSTSGALLPYPFPSLWDRALARSHDGMQTVRLERLSNSPRPRGMRTCTIWFCGWHSYPHAGCTPYLSVSFCLKKFILR